jgi:energy-coupling factor transporter ATP-binding protein EcfA2
MLKSLRIRNFRGLRNVEIRDAKRINLITGRNNTGKTALLEALSLATTAPNANALVLSYNRRTPDAFMPDGSGTIDHSWWRQMFTDMNVGTPIELTVQSEEQFFTVTIRTIDNPDLKARILQNPVYRPSTDSVVNQAEFTVLEVAKRPDYKDAGEARYIIMNQQQMTVGGTNNSVQTLFFAARQPNVSAEDNERFTHVDLAGLKEEVLNAMRIVDPDIQTLEILAQGKPRLWAGNGHFKLPLSQYGDGLSRLTSLLLGIAASSSGYVFIDEFENGLHYSVLKDLWRAVYQLAMKVNVQVFATTHSQECVEAALEVFEAPGIAEKDFMIYRVQKRDNTPEVVSFDTEAAEVALDMGVDLRGLR